MENLRKIVDELISSGKRIKYKNVERENLSNYFSVRSFSRQDSLHDILPTIREDVQNSGVVLVEDAARYREKLPEIVKYLSGNEALSFEGNASRSLRQKFRSSSKNIYNTTQLLKKITLLQHNENSYHNKYPAYLALFCYHPCERENGATPLTRNEDALSMAPPNVIAELKKRGFAFRRYLPSIENKQIQAIAETINRNSLQTLLPISTWQEIFSVDNVPDLKMKLRDKVGIESLEEDEQQGVLYTVKKDFQDPVFLSPLNLYRFCGNSPTEVKHHLQKIFPNPDLENEIEKLAKYNLTVGWTFFENDEPIPDDCFDAVRNAIVSATIRFSWQENDLLILDNKRVMHGRESYVDGDREIAVSFS